MYEIIIQAIGILGIIASIISFQMKEHRKILVFRSANELLFGIQYLMLGAYTGMAMNFIGVVRNSIFSRLVRKGKSTVAARILFSVIFAVFILFTWAGSKSLLSGGAKILSTFAYGCSNTTVVRICIFITSSCWFAYNLSVKSYAGCACEILTIISIIIGIIKFDILAKNKKKTHA